MEMLKSSKNKHFNSYQIENGSQIEDGTYVTSLNDEAGNTTSMTYMKSKSVMKFGLMLILGLMSVFAVVKLTACHSELDKSAAIPSIRIRIPLGLRNSAPPVTAEY